MTAYELLVKGYQKPAEGGEEADEIIKKDNHRPPTSLEKLIQGYNKDGSQKDKETKIDVTGDEE